MQSVWKQLVLGTLFLLSLFSIGCGSMCVSTPDCEFHAYGGLRDRQDRVNGRVASLFDPAIAAPGYVPPEEPLPPEEVDDADSDDGDDSAEDGGIDDEADEPWQKDLYDELDKMNLPSDESLDGEPGDSSGAGESNSDADLEEI